MPKKVISSLVEAINAGYCLSIADCISIMHFAPLHIRKLCREGKVDAIKYRGQWLVKESSAKAYEGKKGSKELTDENQRLLQLIKELEGKIKAIEAK